MLGEDVHNRDAGRLCYAIKRLVRLGTAVKDVNILLYGKSNAGKTALSRPLMAPDLVYKLTSIPGN
jgi:hypothetical protein